MRFRALMTDIGHVHSFTRILASISKVCKVCVLQLSQSSLGFVYTDKVVNGGTRLWCNLEQGDLFDEYRIEGKDERNEIYLEIITDNLVRAMKSAQNSQALKIKLTRKQTACLTFEVSLPSLVSHARSVTHDVPVGIIPSRFWEDYDKPSLPQYDEKTTDFQIFRMDTSCQVEKKSADIIFQISVSMPNIKTLKNVVDRMKNVSHFVVVAANRAGQLTLEVETDEVTITTYFKHMDVDIPESSSNDERPDVIRRDERFEARIDIQKLYSFLHAQQASPNRIICNISEGHSIHVILHTDETILNYFLPAMISG